MNRVEHLLTCLIEECSEVQKEATKALRFGLDDKYKDQEDQAKRIVNEFLDLITVFEMLVEEGVMPNPETNFDLKIKKRERVLKYMDYAIERKTLIK